MASTKKPIINQQPVINDERLKQTEELLNKTQSFIADYNVEASAIDLELERHKLKLAEDIKRKQDAIIEIFNKRATELEEKRISLAIDVYKKHGSRFGTKKELKEKPYEELIQILKQEPKSIWITVRKMFKF